MYIVFSLHLYWMCCDKHHLVLWTGVLKPWIRFVPERAQIWKQLQTHFCTVHICHHPHSRKQPCSICFLDDTIPMALIRNLKFKKNKFGKYLLADECSEMCYFCKENWSHKMRHMHQVWVHVSSLCTAFIWQPTCAKCWHFTVLLNTSSVEKCLMRSVQNTINSH